GSFIEYIERRVRATKLKAVIFSAIFVLLVENSVPFILGQTAMSNAYVKSSEYSTLDNFLFNQPGFYRHLWLPRGSKWSTGNYDKPGYSADILMSGLWLKYISLNTDYDAKKIPGLIVSSFNKPYSKNLLSSFSFKYIIVPFQDKTNDADFFSVYGTSQKYFIDSLDKISYLKKIDIRAKNITVYENLSYKPHIYLTSQKETIYSDLPYKKIDFSFINPTKYIVNLYHVSMPIYLNFSDSFNPNWELRLGTFNWLEALYKKKYFLTVNHFANDAGLNSFYINPTSICSGSFSCTRNSDGSYDMHLTLYFQPQSYLYAGLIVSGITFFIILVILGYFGIKEIKSYGRKH
ncbi:MAG: hypothetical protein KGL95_16175, partial [Patescibacteria group bacterium]|nr:hypothetical protein [Patescibacteria group bacterium]